MTKTSILGLIVSVLALTAPQHAFSAGFLVNEHSAKAMAMANAYTALADTPAAIVFNPAGLAQLKGLQLEAGVTILAPGFTNTMTNPTTGEEIDVAVKNRFFPVPTMFGSYAIHDRVTVGMGVFAPFGLGVEWPETTTVNGAEIPLWFRDQIQEIDLKTAFLSTVGSFRITDQIMVGAGFNVVWGQVHLNRAVINSSDPADDVDVDLAGDDFGFGASAGVLVKIIPDLLNAGVNYRSAVSLSFDGNAAFTKDGSAANVPAGIRSRLVDGPVNAGVVLPHFFSFSLAGFPIKDKLTVSASVDLIMWSSFKELKIDFLEHPELSVLERRDWKNTIALRFGAEYKFRPHIAARIGYDYDQSPAPNDTIGAELPDAPRHLFALGGGYTIKGLRIDAAYNFLLTGKHQTDPVAPFPGMRSATVHILGLSLGYNISL